MFVLKSSTISEKKMIYKTGANMFKQWELKQVSASPAPPSLLHTASSPRSGFQHLFEKNLDQRFPVKDFWFSILIEHLLVFFFMI